MSATPPEKFAMLYDREHNSEALIMQALQLVARHRGLLYLIGGCESAAANMGNSWLPQPADRVAEDLVALARMARGHGLLLDGRVLAEPGVEQLQALLTEQDVRHILRAAPGTPGAARSAWSNALQQAAQSLHLPVTLIDTTEAMPGGAR